MSEMSERNSVLVAYGLYLLGAVTGGLTTLAGMILAMVKLDGARGTLFESHYRNMILVFWVWLAVIVGAGAMILAGVAGVAFSLFAAWPMGGLAVIPAALAFWLIALGVVATCLWYYWRLVRGLVLTLDDKPF
ncbi:MAG TPA: hypothetical protein VN718_06320 [Rhizomicrobium sp.]|nr:hypothetical protein [Rhizomicrobium sp.]